MLGDINTLNLPTFVLLAQVHAVLPEVVVLVLQQIFLMESSPR